MNKTTFCVNDVFDDFPLVKNMDYDSTREWFLDCDIRLAGPILSAIDQASVSGEGQLVFLPNKTLIQVEVSNAK
jgi:hypothetical protein